MSIPRATSPGPRRRQHGPAGEVQSITNAPERLADDQTRRLTRYLVQMGIRVVCILAAVLFADSWLFWVFVVGAVVLPYSAVIFANAGRDRVSYDTSPVTAAGPVELPASTGPAAGPTTAPGAGRVVEHQPDAPADGDGRAQSEDRSQADEGREETR